MKRLILVILTLTLSFSSFSYTGKEGSLERTIHNSQILMNQLNILISKSNIYHIDNVCTETISINNSNIFNSCLFDGNGISYITSDDGYNYSLSFSTLLNSNYTIIPTNNSIFDVYNKTESGFDISCISQQECSLSFQVFGDLSNSSKEEVLSKLSNEMTTLDSLIKRKSKAVAQSQISWAEVGLLESVNTINNNTLISVESSIIDAETNINNIHNEYINTINTSYNKTEDQINSDVNNINQSLTLNVNNKITELTSVTSSIATDVSNTLSAEYSERINSKYSNAVNDISSKIKVPASNCAGDEYLSHWDGSKWHCRKQFVALGTIDFALSDIARNQHFENIEKVEGVSTGVVHITLVKPISITSLDTTAWNIARYAHLQDDPLNCRASLISSNKIKMEMFKDSGFVNGPLYPRGSNYCSFVIEGNFIQ